MLCWQDILHITDEEPLAGHLEKNKTGKRISQHFYWPRPFAMCETSVEVVQNVRKSLVGRSLVFSWYLYWSYQCLSSAQPWILWDPWQRAGKVTGISWLSVIMPPVILRPSPCIEAVAIAEELVKVFSRVGIPQDILPDQGSNFTSKLLQEPCKLLHILSVLAHITHRQTGW